MVKILKEKTEYALIAQEVERFLGKGGFPILGTVATVAIIAIYCSNYWFFKVVRLGKPHQFNVCFRGAVGSAHPW